MRWIALRATRPDLVDSTIFKILTIDGHADDNQACTTPTFRWNEMNCCCVRILLKLSLFRQGHCWNKDITIPKRIRSWFLSLQCKHAHLFILAWLLLLHSLLLMCHQFSLCCRSIYNQPSTTKTMFSIRNASLAALLIATANAHKVVTPGGLRVKDREGDVNVSLNFKCHGQPRWYFFFSI